MRVKERNVVEVATVEEFRKLENYDEFPEVGEFKTVGIGWAVENDSIYVYLGYDASRNHMKPGGIKCKGVMIKRLYPRSSNSVMKNRNIDLNSLRSRWHPSGKWRVLSFRIMDGDLCAYSYFLMTKDSKVVELFTTEWTDYAANTYDKYFPMSIGKMVMALRIPSDVTELLSQQYVTGSAIMGTSGVNNIRVEESHYDSVTALRISCAGNVTVLVIDTGTEIKSVCTSVCNATEDEQGRILVDILLSKKGEDEDDDKFINLIFCRDSKCNVFVGEMITLTDTLGVQVLRKLTYCSVDNWACIINQNL